MVAILEFLSTMTSHRSRLLAQSCFVTPLLFECLKNGRYFSKVSKVLFFFPYFFLYVLKSFFGKFEVFVWNFWGWEGNVQHAGRNTLTPLLHFIGLYFESNRFSYLEVNSRCIFPLIFSFPLKDAARTREWVKVVGPDFYPNSSSSLCSKHFRAECFKSEGNGKRLRNDAIPVSNS